MRLIRTACNYTDGHASWEVEERKMNGTIITKRRNVWKIGILRDTAFVLSRILSPNP